MTNHEIGKLGEEYATKYLLKKSYSILERNFRIKGGEIDIIAKDNYEFVFVEVKTRSDKSFGEPAEAVDKDKKKHIYKTAKYYLYKKKLECAFVRFDVIEVLIKGNNKNIRHLKNVDM